MKASVPDWFPSLEQGGLYCNLTHNTIFNEKINSNGEKPKNKDINLLLNPRTEREKYTFSSKVMTSP
jgi:hypothetical protein